MIQALCMYKPGTGLQGTNYGNKIEQLPFQ